MGSEKLREIDDLIATHIMGYELLSDKSKVNRIINPPTPNGSPWCVPFYTLNIKAAWEVLEKLRSNKFYPSIHSHEEKYVCVIPGFPGIQVEADTASLAICLAALETKGISL